MAIFYIIIIIFISIINFFTELFCKCKVICNVSLVIKIL